MFKYSAFIENTSEIREYMESIDYRQRRLASAGGNVICTLSDGWYDIENSTTGKDMFGAYLELFKPIDCTGNPELFKAVTAIRDDSDYMQWFILDEYRQCGIGGNIVGLEPRKKIGEKWFLYKSDDLKITKAINQDIEHSFFGKSDMHKATLEELIEHFKK